MPPKTDMSLPAGGMNLPDGYTTCPKCNRILRTTDLPDVACPAAETPATAPEPVVEPAPKKDK